MVPTPEGYIGVYYIGVPRMSTARSPHEKNYGSTSEEFHEN